ncbi:sigma factor-like helix-turn-helix DNA-binding protein [Anaerosacchariphilus polymeriproducens]|uniref:RNA polymerase sigma-70 region 4 domain-containing protein n=1 Tax=Anaerosacchariphilus polymeriproducens TaxID=1812858 RepID=A0A371AUL4_9FIRM|nr:sigma factor-like helix-turn-helix DNA-binding protein [Anaerosacchariphilus polymeriproducens]RDU23232.1 hypothetical protein DWV06_10670 [Anaerosacchariphilus polymeriproducens]
MQCKECGENYAEEMFPVCPYCLTPSNKNELYTQMESDKSETEVCENDITDVDNDEILVSDSKDNEEELVEESKSEITSATEKDLEVINIPSFSMRTKNVLRRNGIFKLSELKSFLNKKEVKDIHGLSVFVEKEITDVHLLTEVVADEDKERIQEETRVSSVYSANKYKLFVEYCKKNGITYMSDFAGFDFMSLMHVQRIGTGKIEDIIKVFDSYCAGELVEENISDYENVQSTTLYGYINEQLLDLNLDFLVGLGIKSKQIKELSSRGFMRISDLQNISVNTLQQIVGIRNIEKFRGIEDLLKKSLIEIFEGILCEYEKEDDLIIDVKKEEGFTLQELGDEYGVTRERIRQKISKFNLKIDPFMNPIVEFFMNPKNYVSTQELLDIYDNDNFDKVLIHWCKNCKSLEYLSFADVFVWKLDEEKSTYDKILDLAIDFIGDGINLYDNLEELETLMQTSNFTYVDGGAFLNLAQEKGYRVYGDFIVKGRQSYGYLCAKIVANKFPDGIKLYGSADLKILRKLALEEYGDLGIPDNDRAFSTRLTDYLVLSGRGTVTAEANIHIAINVLDDIKDYIDGTQEGEVYYAELYTRFEGMLRMMSNIDNYNFLHGVLKLYFSNDYDFSNRDYLKKHGDGYVSGKLSIKVKNCIEAAGVPLHRNEIKKKVLGLTDIVLFSAIASEQELFQWDYNYYYSTALMQIDESDIEYLMQQTDTIMDKNEGYCSDNMLLDEVKRFRRNFLIKNRIESSNNLYYLCQKLLSDRYDFRRPHITRKGLMEEISVRNVALHLLGSPILLSFKTYQDMAEHLKWSPVTTGMVFGEIEKEYIRITDDSYLKTEEFKIDNTSVKEIENVLINNMSNDYISLINFDLWEMLPDIKYEWNIYLLRSIIDKFISELRIIEIRAKDRRYERGIVVKREMELSDYADLVAYFMRKMGYSDLSENNMLTLLVMNNLTYKMIPKDLFLSDKIIYQNEHFMLA